MAECSACVCAVCYRPLSDARLLDCFHSFCKTCIGDLAMRTAHAHEISCPLCRSKNCLPDTGANGLPKDITVQEERPCDCRTCEEDGKHTKPELLCATCDVPFCKDHGFAHLLANSGHIIKPFAEASGGQAARRRSAASRHCEAHDRPLEYFCKQCDKGVCADCSIIGEHHGHKPIVAMKEIARDLKQRVIRKLDKLKTARLPCVQKALLDVDKVTSELSSRAEQVRTKIRWSRKCVLEAVELLFEQKLAEVDDLEDLRLKHLGSQEAELNMEADGLRGMLRFGEKIIEMDVETEEVCDLLSAVDKRSDELENAEVEEVPVEHACLAFEEVKEDELLTKASALVGVVLPFHASATRSFVQGETKKTCTKNLPVNFIVVAKDKSGGRLAKGGDQIRAEIHQTAAEVGRIPAIDVVDKDDGTYVISVRAGGNDECSLDVFVNNVRLRQRLLITCKSLCFTLDPAKCDPLSKISDDQLTATHTGRDMVYSVVLSSHSMRSGEHVWKVSVISSESETVEFMCLGVAKTPDIPSMCLYGWHGGTGDKGILGEWSEGIPRWENNDVLQFHLNCTERTLTITNCRSRKTSTITDLPQTELFAYFCTYRTGQSFTLLQ